MIEQGKTDYQKSVVSRRAGNPWIGKIQGEKIHFNWILDQHRTLMFRL